MLDWLTLGSDLVRTALAALPRQLAIVVGVSLFIKAFPRLSASNRHCIWAWTAVTVALIPLLTWVLPKWSVVPATLGVFDEDLVHTVYLLAAAWSPLLEETIVIDADRSYGKFSWTAAIIGGWIAGVLFFGWSLLFSWLGLARFQRGRLPVVDGPMSERLQAMQRLAGVGSFVGLFSSFRCSLPMTWGFFKPAIHLPSDAEDWPYGRLDAVLLHELAHIRRGDALTNLFLRICCALNWFNPLVWHTAKKAWLAQEQACDDFACARMRSSQYAQHLLQVAASLGPRRMSFAPAALGISASEQLSVRLTSILDTRRNRKAATPRFALFTFGSLGWFSLTVCVMSLYPVEPAMEPPPVATPATHGWPGSSLGGTSSPQGSGISWEEFLVQTISRLQGDLSGAQQAKSGPSTGRVEGQNPDRSQPHPTLQEASMAAPTAPSGSSSLAPGLTISFSPLVTPSPLLTSEPPTPPAAAPVDPPPALPLEPAKAKAPKRAIADQFDWRSLQRDRGTRRNGSVVRDYQESLCLRYAKLSPFDQAKYGSLQDYLRLNRVHLDAASVEKLLDRLKNRSF